MNDIWFCIWHWCDAYTKNRCTMVDKQLRGLKHAYDLYCEHKQLFLPQVPIYYNNRHLALALRKMYQILLPGGTHQLLYEPVKSQTSCDFAIYMSPRWRCGIFLVDTPDLVFRERFKLSVLYWRAIKINTRRDSDNPGFVKLSCKIAHVEEPSTPSASATITTPQVVTNTFRPLPDYLPYDVYPALIEFISQTEIIVVFGYCAPPDIPLAPEYYVMHAVCVNETWIIKSCEPYTHTFTQDVPAMHYPTFHIMCRENGNTNELTNTYVWTMPGSVYELQSYLACYRLDSRTRTFVRTPQCIEYVCQPRTRAASPTRLIPIDTESSVLCQWVATDHEFTLICTGLRRDTPRVDFVRYLPPRDQYLPGYNAWRRNYDQSIMLACYQSTDNCVDIYNLTEGSALMARLLTFAQPVPKPPFAEPVIEVVYK